MTLSGVWASPGVYLVQVPKRLEVAGRRRLGFIDTEEGPLIVHAMQARSKYLR